MEFPKILFLLLLLICSIEIESAKLKQNQYFYSSSSSEIVTSSSSNGKRKTKVKMSSYFTEEFKEKKNKEKGFKIRKYEEKIDAHSGKPIKIQKSGSTYVLL